MRILVEEKIVWYTGATLDKGRLLRASPDSVGKIKEDYGDKVTVWPNWPAPLVKVEKKKKKAAE